MPIDARKVAAVVAWCRKEAVENSQLLGVGFPSQLMFWDGFLGRQLAGQFIQWLVLSGLGHIVDEIDVSRWQNAQSRVAELSRWADRLEEMIPQNTAVVALPSSDIRPAHSRDHLFLEWSEEGLGPAAVRDRWNDMSIDERRAICPRAPGQLGPKDKGRNAVRAAISKAKRERDKLTKRLQSNDAQTGSKPAADR